MGQLATTIVMFEMVGFSISTISLALQIDKEKPKSPICNKKLFQNVQSKTMALVKPEKCKTIAEISSFTSNTYQLIH